MKIGLISDTHGNFQRTARAIDLFKAHCVSAVIHCGDFGTEAILKSLASTFEPLGVPVYAVLGNVDLYDPVSDRDLDRTGVHMLGRVGVLNLDGKRIGVVHGDDAYALRDAIHGGDFDYVFTGHTHCASDDRLGKTRIINPGAAHRASTPSCAVLDLETDTLTYLPLDR